MQSMTSKWATGTYELLMQETGDDLLITVFALATDPNTDDWDTPVLAQEEIDRVPGAPVMKHFQIGEDGIRPEDLELNLGSPRLALRVLMTLHEAALQDSRGLDYMDAPFRAPSPAALAIAERFNDTALLLATRLFSM